MWRYQDKINATKAEILLQEYNLEISDLWLIRAESYKPFKNRDFLSVRQRFNDSFMIDGKKKVSAYCFNSSEVFCYGSGDEISLDLSKFLSKERTIVQPYTMHKDKPLIEVYNLDKIIQLRKVKHKGCDYYIGIDR